MDIQWVNKGYPSLITDPAPPQEVGGPTKIDSIQNVILLRSDLHGAWDNYQIAVNPDVCINFFLFMVSVLTLNLYSEDMLLSLLFPKLETERPISHLCHFIHRHQPATPSKHEMEGVRSPT